MARQATSQAQVLSRFMSIFIFFIFTPPSSLAHNGHWCGLVALRFAVGDVSNDYFDASRNTTQRDTIWPGWLHTYIPLHGDGQRALSTPFRYNNNLYSNSNNHLSALQWSKKDPAALRLATQRKSSSWVANPQHVLIIPIAQVSVSHYIPSSSTKVLRPF